MVKIVNVADLIDPQDPQGRSYRQINASREHEIPLGALVELQSGERLYVVQHTRDCDATPLYRLGLKYYFEFSDDDDNKIRLTLGDYGKDSFTLVRSNVESPELGIDK